ncbi:MAG: YHS domain-containing protein [Myxococcales bacterium]|nr:YHS domain-containing protein [Myxococcales bacterium]
MIPRMKKLAFLLLSSFLVFQLAACGGKDGASEARADVSAGDESPLVPPGETKIGDRSTCPVSGEEFVVTESSPTVVHEGRTYHFCCPGCAARFEADPDKYLGAPVDAEDDED